MSSSDRGEGAAETRLRLATLADAEAIGRLIGLSARAFCVRDYPRHVVEGALTGPFGVDTTLIEDGTYFVLEAAGRLVACGGWSRRATPFGGDAYAGRDDRTLDPARDRARIRAFFVDPEAESRGLGRRVLSACEDAARAEGYERFQLTATLNAEAFYARHGYVAGPRKAFPVPGGTIEFVPMTKG